MIWKKTKTQISGWKTFYLFQEQLVYLFVLIFSLFLSLNSYYVFRYIKNVYVIGSHQITLCLLTPRIYKVNLNFVYEKCWYCYFSKTLRDKDLELLLMIKVYL